MLRSIQYRHAAKLHRHSEGGHIFRQCITIGQSCGKQVAAGTGSFRGIVVTAPAAKRNSLRAILCGSGNLCRKDAHNFIIENRAFRAGQGKGAAFRVNDLQLIHPAPRRNLCQTTQSADIGTGMSLHCRDISADSVMFMRAVQLLHNTAAFYAANMAALCRLRSLVARNAVFQYRIALRCMYMNTACDLGIALRPRLVGAGAFLSPLHITAGFVMSRVVSAQAACADDCAAVLCGKRYRWQHPRHKAG